MVDADDDSANGESSNDKLGPAALWIGLPAYVTAIAAIAALVFTGLSLGATRDQIAVSEQGQVTDRFASAIEQLGSVDSLELRLGGLYSLERIAQDSARDQGVIVEVLSAFIRQRAEHEASGEGCVDSGTTVDVQAAITILGRRNVDNDDGRKPDLHGACLHGIEAHGLNFAGANFANVKFYSADFRGANLRGVDFVYADLLPVNFAGADLSGAYLQLASMARCNLGANLRDANLNSANLTDCSAIDADFTNADLRDARLDRVNFEGVDLSNVAGS